MFLKTICFEPLFPKSIWLNTSKASTARTLLSDIFKGAIIPCLYCDRVRWRRPADRSIQCGGGYGAYIYSTGLYLSTVGRTRGYWSKGGGWRITVGRVSFGVVQTKVRTWNSIYSILLIATYFGATAGYLWLIQWNRYVSLLWNKYIYFLSKQIFIKLHKSYYPNEPIFNYCKITSGGEFDRHGERNDSGSILSRFRIIYQQLFSC